MSADYDRFCTHGKLVSWQRGNSGGSAICPQCVRVLAVDVHPDTARLDKAERLLAAGCGFGRHHIGATPRVLILDEDGYVVGPTPPTLRAALDATDDQPETGKEGT